MDAVGIINAVKVQLLQVRNIGQIVPQLTNKILAEDIQREMTHDDPALGRVLKFWLVSPGGFISRRATGGSRGLLDVIWTIRIRGFLQMRESGGSEKRMLEIIDTMIDRMAVNTKLQSDGRTWISRELRSGGEAELLTLTQVSNFLCHGCDLSLEVTDRRPVEGTC